MQVTSNPMKLDDKWRDEFSGRTQITGKVKGTNAYLSIETAVAGKEAVYYDKSEIEGKSLGALGNQGYFNKLTRGVQAKLEDMAASGEHSNDGLEIFQNLGLIKPEAQHPFLQGNFKNMTERVLAENDYWRSQGFENGVPDPNRPIQEQLKERL